MVNVVLLGLKLFLRFLGLVLRLVVWVVRIFLHVTFGFAWRQTFSRSDVYVRRDWDDRGLGRVRWSDLNSPRWDTMSGGTQSESPLPLLYGYVWCDKVRGMIGHSCAHGPGPHNIKVCMLREDNIGRIWRRLLVLAGPDRRLDSR